jgi:hypothetical protein
MERMAWETAMGIWKNLSAEENRLLRRAAVQKMIDRGCEEVGTSDVNHEVYALVAFGEYREAIEDQRRLENAE